MAEEIPPKTLSLYPIDYPFETLHGRITAKPPKLILNPDFQRKYKWDKTGWERASKFIESCLMRIPLPSCYFAEDEQGKHKVIDGVQRLTTIVKFLDNEFALEGLTTFKELEGKKFSELGEYQVELETATIRCVVLRKENPKNLVREIFSRLNKGSVELSDQEIRHAMNPGKFNDLLGELAAEPVIAKFGLGVSSERQKNSREAEEQVLRYFALRGKLDGYNDKLSRYLDDYMSRQSDCADDEIINLRNEFKETLNKCVSVFGENVFVDTTTRRRRQRMVYYDLLMHSLRNKDVNDSNKESIKQKFVKLCESSSFRKTLSSGLQNKSSILKRRELWNSILEE